jgi:hypothetical protein
MATDPYSIDVSKTYYDTTGKKLSDSLDTLWRQTKVGSIRSAIGDNVYGINHRQTPGSIGINRDYFGLTFFTRPRLNLSTENLRAIRQFSPMLSNVANSWPRVVRCLLDPTLATPFQPLVSPISSDYVDPHQAFIPLLTNTLVSNTGWPDIEALTFTAHEGIYKESYSFIDSSVSLYGTYDITANFRNIPGDPILLLFLTWLQYASLVYLGDIIPYPDALIANEIDYNTRIYRLVLDPSKRFVTKIAATGASFPLNVPYGAAINHDGDHPVNMANAQISIQFRSNGVMYSDPILIDEFNRTSAMFNDAMSDKYFTTSRDASGNIVTTNSIYKQIPIAALDLFNNRGYPRINPYTYELEWWVDTQEYNYRLPQITASTIVANQKNGTATSVTEL